MGPIITERMLSEVNISDLESLSSTRNPFIVLVKGRLIQWLEISGIHTSTLNMLDTVG